MIQNPFPKTLLASGAAAALFLGSCAYDPYYGGVSHTQTYTQVGGGYGHGYGYGYGHGYGGSSFSTSFLISTGHTRWGYDPYTYAYYDYTRRAYYDPYLYGYYPVGYRPPILVGVPHPHGWRHGRVMPPPRRVRTVTLTNYHDRGSAYRQSQHSWAPRVREDRRPPAQATPQPRGGRHSAFNQPTTTAQPRPWDRSASPAGSPAMRPDERQRNPTIREREDSRRGVAPAPSARPGTAWQGASSGRPAPESRAPALPPEYNRPIAVTPPAATRQPATRPDFSERRAGGEGPARGRPQTERVPRESAPQPDVRTRTEGQGRGPGESGRPSGEERGRGPGGEEGRRR